MQVFSGLLAPALLLSIRAMPSLAQTDMTEGVLTIQTIEPSDIATVPTDVPSIASSQDGATVFEPTVSVASSISFLPSCKSKCPAHMHECQFVTIPLALEGTMSALPEPSDISLSGFPTTSVSGIMSIPGGETPMFTNGTSLVTVTTTAASSESTEDSTDSATESSASPTDTGSAAPIVRAGDGIPVFLVACSALSAAFGFAFILL